MLGSSGCPSEFIRGRRALHDAVFRSLRDCYALHAALEAAAGGGARAADALVARAAADRTSLEAGHIVSR